MKPNYFIMRFFLLSLLCIFFMGNWEPILAGEVDVSLLDGITNTAEGNQYLGDNTNYNYLVVDDFESYSIDPETFRTIWLDGSGHFTDTGELVRNGSGSYAKLETQKVHDGAQSMYLSYDNIGGWCPHLYSEVERTWDTAQDWTANDTTVLTLWIRGYEWNSNESFYVGLEDTDHIMETVTHSDPNIVQQETWIQWRIPLPAFVGVNLKAIRKLYIGVGDRSDQQPGGLGEVFIDDIYLERPVIELIYPADGDEVNEPLPLLCWNDFDPPIDDRTFSIKICEVLEGQTAQEAIANNETWLQTDGISIPFLLGTKTFETGKKYCWTVKALIGDDTIATSETYSFQFTDQELSPERLLDLIPSTLTGFGAPISAESSVGETLEEVALPGGYAGREWWSSDMKEFVLAIILDYQSETEATDIFAELDLYGTTSFDFADSALKGEELMADGRPVFRIIIFRQGKYIVVVASGTTDKDIAPPSHDLLMELAQGIETNIKDNLSTSVDSGAFIPRITSYVEAANKKSNQSILAQIASTPELVGNLSPSLAGMSDGCEHVADAELTMEGKTVGGMILVFAVEKQGTCDKACSTYTQCDLLQVFIRIDSIYLKKEAFDGDRDLPFADDGDMMIGGVITVFFTCENTVAHRISFTTAEVGDLCEGECLYIKKSINSVLDCQCPTSAIRVSWELLMRDNDSGDIGDILMNVEKLILTKTTGTETAEVVDKVKEQLRNKGQDTTGPEAWQRLRAISGNDVGTSIETGMDLK